MPLEMIAKKGAGWDGQSRVRNQQRMVIFWG